MITKAEKKSGASSKRNATTNKNQINKNLQRYNNWWSFKSDFNWLL